MILTRLILTVDALFYGMVYFHSMYPYYGHRRLNT